MTSFHYIQIYVRYVLTLKTTSFLPPGLWRHTFHTHEANAITVDERYTAVHGTCLSLYPHCEDTQLNLSSFVFELAELHFKIQAPLILTSEKSGLVPFLINSAFPSMVPILSCFFKLISVRYKNNLISLLHLGFLRPLTSCQSQNGGLYIFRGGAMVHSSYHTAVCLSVLDQDTWQCIQEHLCACSLFFCGGCG